MKQEAEETHYNIPPSHVLDSTLDIASHGILFLLKAFLHGLPKTVCTRQFTEALFTAAKIEMHQSSMGIEKKNELWHVHLIEDAHAGKVSLFTDIQILKT